MRKIVDRGWVVVGFQILGEIISAWGEKEVLRGETKCPRFVFLNFCLKFKISYIQIKGKLGSKNQGGLKMCKYKMGSICQSNWSKGAIFNNFPFLIDVVF